MANREAKKHVGSEQRRLSVSWPPFGARLATVLGALEEDQFLTVMVKRSNSFVQFFCQGQSGMRAETTSNAYLARSERLDARQVAALAALGWTPPTGGAGESTPDNDPDGSPNFFVDFDHGVAFGVIADLAVRTFTEVLRVPYPSLLEYQAGDMDGSSLELSTLELRQAAPRAEADDEEDPAQLLLKMVEDATGLKDLEYDRDGDIGVFFGSMVAFVRLTGDPPNVRIFSPLIVEVEETDELLARINEINRGTGHMHLFLDDETVYAVSEIAATPLVREHLERGLNNFCQIADGLDDLLEAEFGGRKLTPDSMPSSLRH
ncbi:MAG: hypothetical protein KJZ83_04210 [Burkholderiaceae bacterium]|nr:hypothetical protein [Burkholderiaceae bacterium]